MMDRFEAQLKVATLPMQLEGITADIERLKALRAKLEIELVEALNVCQSESTLLTSVTIV
jgi:hypothetical protein